MIIVEQTCLVLACLCIGLCFRIMSAKKQIAMLEYDDRETLAQRNKWRELAWKRENQIDKLEKSRDRLANELVIWKDAVAAERLLRNEAEDIANEAMTVGLESLATEWYAGRRAGYREGLAFAAGLCRLFPTSKGSTLAKRISS